MRLVSNKSVGAAAVLQGLVLALIKLWPTFGISRGSAFTWWFVGLAVGRSIVVVVLDVWVAFGLWRLAAGRRGQTSLKVSFALVCASLLSLPLLVVLPALVGRGGSLWLVSQLWVSAALGFAAAAFLLVGLLRSTLVPPAVAWFGGIVATAGALLVVVGAPATYAMFVHGTLTTSPAATVWFNRAVSWLGILPSIAVGLSLLLGGASRGFVEQALPADSPSLS